jgi:hypothetical protein
MANFLGLSVGDKSLLAAEVSVGRDKSELRRVAEFVYPAEASMEQPEALGSALAQFLRQKGFSSSRAVVGVPARWLIAREKEVPPSRPDAAVGMLKLASERLMSADLAVVFDFTGTTDVSAPTKVLLVGVLKQQLDRINAMADSAGLNLLAVTSSTLALASAARESGGIVVSLTQEAVEVSARSKGKPVLLRHLGSHALRGSGSASAVSLLGNELRRAVSMAPLNGDNGTSRSMLLWDGLGLAGADAAALGQRSGMATALGEGMSSLGIHANGTHGEDTLRYGPAAALALAGSDKDLLAVDFLHSRLATRKESRIGKRGQWAILIGTVLVLGIGGLVADVQWRQAKLNGIEADLLAIKDPKEVAQRLQEKVSYANGWFDARPKDLECLKELWSAFRDDDPIWGTNISMKERQTIKDQQKGTITGSASDRQAAINIAERLRGNKKFIEVLGPDIHERGGVKEKDFVYTITFTFKG